MKHLDMLEPYYDIQLSSTQRVLILQDLYDLDLKTFRQSLLRLEIEKALQFYLALRDTAYNISTVSGISAYSAVWILAELGGIARFHNIRQFLSYCGLVPRIVSSADKVYSAHISRHSNKYLRGIFYQAAVVVSNVVKNESDLKVYADRMKWLKKNWLKVAYCTTAAKICFGILKSNTPFFEYFTNAHSHTSISFSNHFSVVEIKELKRAKRVLQRIRTIKGMELVESDIEGLECSLEDILAKK